MIKSKYALFAGLGGGFGGMSFNEVVEYEGENEEANQEKANDDAYELACQEYECYAGLHGLRDENQIAEEEGLDVEEDSDEINSIYEEERESWLSYKAVKIPDDIEETEEAVNEYIDSLDEK